jgi:hypothetical protein
MADGDPIIIGDANTASNPGAETSLSRNDKTPMTVFAVRSLHAGDAVHGEAVDGYGVFGRSDTREGVVGYSHSRYGVTGLSFTGTGVAALGRSTGVLGTALTGSGVLGYGTSIVGVNGLSDTNVGVQGSSRSGAGVAGSSKTGIGVFGESDTDHGVRGVSRTGFGVYGTSPGSIGVGGGSDSNVGVFGESDTSDGVRGVSRAGFGASGTSDGGIGVGGGSGTNVGVGGRSRTSFGVSGTSDGGIGVRGIGLSGGVFGQTVSATAVLGIATIPAGLAGAFLGGGFVSGHLLVGGGLDVIGTKNFKIDHPSDPENKYLVHTCVESSQMKNVYDGAARLDEDGSVWVALPEWFEALNGDFRYQLTAVGGPAPRLHVAEEIAEGRFKIAGGEAGMKVCWQVTGSRKDPWAAANPFKVEQDKREQDRGRYLEPRLYGAPEEQRIIVESVAATLRAAAGSPTGQDAIDELRRRIEEGGPRSRATDIHLDQMDEARRLAEEQRRELAELLRRMDQQPEAPPETT